MNLTLREIPETDIGPFFDLIGEIECGDDYDSAIPTHVAWVEETIRRRYGSGVRFYGMYDDTDKSKNGVWLIKDGAEPEKIICK